MSAPPPPATATNEIPNLCKKNWCLRRQRPRRSAATGQTIRRVAAGILFRRRFPVRRVEKSIRRSSVGWAQPERLRTRTGTPIPSRIFLATCRNQKNGASLQQCGFALSTPFHKYDPVCCVDFRFWRGATSEHPPKWGCDRGATKPEPKIDATLRAAGLFGPDLVAHSLQTSEGYARRSRLVWAKNPSPQTWSYL